MNYSPDLKEKVINEVREIKSITAVSKKNNIPTSTIAGWLKKSNISTKDKSESSKKDLKVELKGLKKKLADAELELMILKDLLKKSYNP